MAPVEGRRGSVEDASSLIEMPSPRGDLQEYQRKRDFSRTAEPSGGVKPRKRGTLAFVVQKHAASHLHFDLRLEMGGVMKSWAVPKGPSVDPSMKRLAMEVEDHPLAYNDFEGTIPAGEYGGGTVMLWDRGSYEPDEVEGKEKPEAALIRGYHKGKIDFLLHGERLRGSFTLVRTGKAERGRKPQWLLIKRTDEFADRTRDVVEEVVTSVETGRTMDEIASGKGKRRVWHSNQSNGTQGGSTPPAVQEKAASAGFSPMLCEIGSEMPEGEGWIYEPKLDGIRVVAFVTDEAVSLLTRNGNDKAKQFPEVVDALRELAVEVDRPVVLDGEIVGLDEKGNYLRFESLQGRMHVQDPRSVKRLAGTDPAGFVAFDLLLEGDEPLVQEEWTERRARLEALLRDRPHGEVRLGVTFPDGPTILRRARAEGWEGVIAKRTDSVYRPGRRSRSWLKLKIDNRQEFVVGGWTEPRNTRQHFGALLLGYFDEAGELIYAGHTGTGFSGRSLEDLSGRLSKLERKSSPFSVKPKTNEPAHWTEPELVVEVKFNEWTSDGKLRHPSFLGVRDDRDPRTVVLEARSLQDAEPPEDAPAPAKIVESPPSAPDGHEPDPLVKAIRELGAQGGSGQVKVRRGESLQLTNLKKVFFPRERYTKGDLLEYYAAMGSLIVPRMAGRPLVLKRYPNGIEGESFYQQAAPDDVPPGVRMEMVRLGEDKDAQPRLVGGSLTTLLYTIQLGAVSYDPWHSRVDALESADYTILDLDPGPGVTFRQVVQVARWVKEELDRLGLHGAAKTSGSSGIHIYLPLPRDTPLEAATLVAQIVAVRVATQHPAEATVERMTRRRPKGTVYVDYLQNILGKTVSGVYAVRAKPGATVSTPIEWDELTDDLDLREFTIRSVPDRVRRVGDLWAAGMKRPNSLKTLLAARAG